MTALNDPCDGVTSGIPFGTTRQRGTQSGLDDQTLSRLFPTVGSSSWVDNWEEHFQHDFEHGNFTFTGQDFETQDCPEAFIAEDNTEEWAAQMRSDISYVPVQSNIQKLNDTAEERASTSPELCFGMIYRTLVTLVGDMQGLDKRLHQHPSSAQRSRHMVLSVTRGTASTGDFCLAFPDGTRLGSLNRQATGALEEIFNLQSLRLEALVDAATVRETIGRATKEKDARVRANINLYGVETISADIGRVCSTHKIWLQRPHPPRIGISYQNPHELQFSDIQITPSKPLEEVYQRPSVLSKSAEAVRKVASDVYATLQRHQRLVRVEGDRRLKTRLLRHQEEGLDFMAQRENGPIPPEFRLWKPLSGDDKGWYRHAVTQRMSREPDPETGGGILADEMGTGKSLSILALVLRTLDDGYRWASDEPADQEPEMRGERKRIRASLIIVPSEILINNWMKEIRKHVNASLRVEKYHGPMRSRLISGIADADVVFTTYHTLVADGGNFGPLQELEWFRIVLDEAHIIRRQGTTFYKCVSALYAQSRWCLTGTPIQNKLEDIGALFAFIGARPFHIMPNFRKFIATPFDESAELRAIASERLTLLLDSFCLRRTRDVLDLPLRQDTLRELEFSQPERDQYEKTRDQMNRKLRMWGEDSNRNRFGLFQIQLQLRILCNHGTFQRQLSWAKPNPLDEKENFMCSSGPGQQFICSVCHQSMPILGSSTYQNRFSGICRHILCSECSEDDNLRSDLEPRRPWECPVCRSSGIPSDPIQEKSKSNDHETYFESIGFSTKMNALVHDIQNGLVGSKSVIFSCWTHTLDLISNFLKHANISFERIDGDTPVKRRQKILDDFEQLHGLPVLIMTVGTGAYGLNLTSANRVFIVEPQWNPSVENQAIARALRVGQSHRVHVIRYMIKGTIEQEMRSQQERKLRIAEVGNAVSTQASLREEQSPSGTQLQDMAADQMLP